MRDDSLARKLPPIERRSHVGLAQQLLIAHLPFLLSSHRTHIGEYDAREKRYYWEYKNVRANVEGVDLGGSAGADLFEDLTDSDDD